LFLSGGCLVEVFFVDGTILDRAAMNQL